MSEPLADFMNAALNRAVGDQMQAMHEKLAAMPKAEREAYMEVRHMYHGPHYDPTFEQDPAQWWRDYRAGLKPNAVDPFA